MLRIKLNRYYIPKDIKNFPICIRLSFRKRTELPHPPIFVFDLVKIDTLRIFASKIGEYKVKDIREIKTVAYVGLLSDQNLKSVHTLGTTSTTPPGDE